jgi:hypothetical protein
MRRRTFAIAAALAALTALVSVPAHAGCGCDKPPPALAAVRPAFASPGATITLFSPQLLAGKTYAVRFTNDDNRTVQATAVLRRDFADGLPKAQLAVQVPSMPPGPTRIRVLRDGTEILKVEREDFTMLQAPLALAQTDGETLVRGYRAAVGKDGTVYLPLDISAIAERMVFDGIGMDFPLLFDADDVAIYNTQGILMQLLGPAEAGIFSILDPGAPHSFELLYDRHEFLTYRAKHLHEGGLGLDASDPAWHADGTRHIDHDRLVLAIRGAFANGDKPNPGVTQAFDLSIVTVRPEGAPQPTTTTEILWSAACNGSGSSGSGCSN